MGSVLLLSATKVLTVAMVYVTNKPNKINNIKPEFEDNGHNKTRNTYFKNLTHVQVLRKGGYCTDMRLQRNSHT